MSKTFKVIKIISEFKIVVNAGTTDAISRGDSLEIYSPGEEVMDPDTGESLGTLDFIKCYLTVTDVFPKMCVCENQETKIQSAISIGSFFENEVRQRIPVNPKEITGTSMTHSSKINIGDLVRVSNS